MSGESLTGALPVQTHLFLGTGHAQNERRTWVVIWLCTAMMVLEIGGGIWFGSIALVADGLHMSTHAGALLLAALAYTFARRHAQDPRFSFGTGKLGDLAGFTSAIVLAMIAILIGYEAVRRFFAPVPIHFAEAIPIAGLGLVINVLSAWLLSGGHHPGHSHGHTHGHAHGEDETQKVYTPAGTLKLEIFESGAPPRFRLHPGTAALPATASITVSRPAGHEETYKLVPRGGWLESLADIPEPHAFTAILELPEGPHRLQFTEAGPAHKADRDNNMRAAIVHVIADAAVSVVVIVGLLLAKTFGWLWMDPLAGTIGAIVIASWAASLIRDTGAILLDMTPDHEMAETMRQAIESEGDILTDFHLWRLGPGHLGAILCIGTRQSARTPAYYRTLLQRFRNLSHITVEVRQV